MSDIISQVRRLVNDGGMSKAGLARAAGLHANTLRDCTEEDWNPTSETLRKLAAFLSDNDETPVLVGAEEIIEEARNGRMYILVDDEDRENEGDLIFAAEKATPELVAFMVRYTSGYLCVPLDGAVCDRLGLLPMYAVNQDKHGTAYTVTVDAKKGVGTGISASDRATTMRALADPAATLLLLCHPHNPNGRDWTVDELTAVADLCRAHGVRIISDEIHADLLRSGRQHTPLAAVAPESDRIITCLAPSKTFNLAGLLFSNIIIPDEELGEAFAERNSGITNPLSLAAATAVYQDGDEWLDALREHLDHNLRLVGETVASRLPHARFEMPDATYLAWIDLGDHAAGIDDLSAFFAREAHVLVEGPHKFVADAEQCIRVNVACPTTKVVEALDRMISALERRSAGAA